MGKPIFQCLFISFGQQTKLTVKWVFLKLDSLHHLAIFSDIIISLLADVTLFTRLKLEQENP
jgi:hypothetical protein